MKQHLLKILPAALLASAALPIQASGGKEPGQPGTPGPEWMGTQGC